MTHLEHMEKCEQAMSLRDWDRAEGHAKEALQICTDRYARAQIAVIRDSIVDKMPRKGFLGLFKKVTQ